MALIHCDYFSDILRLSTSMTVILPQNSDGQIGLSGKVVSGRYPTLLLLHGLSDDHTIWLRRTSIERYAAEYGLAVVMPAAHRSFYTDMKQGYRYWTFISEEVLKIARSFFPLSTKREDNFVAGLSMGGYGAFKLAFRKPECFAAAASLSGTLDMKGDFNILIKEQGKEMFAECKRIFGNIKGFNKSENDLFSLSSCLKKAGKPFPHLFQICGKEDLFYDGNIRFRDHLNRLNIPLTYSEHPGFHEWGFWDKHIQEVLKWLPFRKKA